MTSESGSPQTTEEQWSALLRSAARLQSLVPDAVLVGGTASALHAGHRVSFDHDHVIADLRDRYEAVLEAVEASEGWATSVRASSPPLTLLGSLDGVWAGLRHLRRTRPLEVEQLDLPEGILVVPTLEEMIRIKAYLVVRRRMVRDFIDLCALSERAGLDSAVAVLTAIDSYYSDRSEQDGSVRSELTLALASPQPKDARVIPQLSEYRGLSPAWQSWDVVAAYCRELAAKLAEAA